MIDIHFFHFRTTPVEIELEDTKLAKTEFLGYILLDLTLIPKYTYDEKEKDTMVRLYPS